MAKESLIIIYGGRSAEREVSVMSAENVVRAVNYDKFIVKMIFIDKAGNFYCAAEYQSRPNLETHLMTNETLDAAKQISPAEVYEKDAVAFPVLHGPMGEDGSIQGFLEILKMPYVGPNIVAAASTMDKLMAKLVFESVDIPQVPYVPAFIDDDREKISKKVDALLEFPVFVKPANMGSSVGISKVNALTDLPAALDEAFQFDTRIVIEQGVDAREVECAVLGNGEHVEATYPGEVVKDKDFYDYKAKYIENRIEMAIPADVPSQTAENIRKNAIKAYQAIGGTGMSRCDFFVERTTGQIYLNEINSIPGFTEYSMYPRLWGNMGLPYSDLIEKLVELGKEAFALREKHLEY